MTSLDSQNTYDDVPYVSRPFAQTHPDRLATLASIFGLAPPPITQCRVLELGCASGGNLIPMAFHLPGSEFVGVDLSRRQVDMGRETIRALGLGNIRIEHGSILDVDESWGQFDYIICHGVFSWVDRKVQDRILEIAGRQLTAQGVAYVSYNTYPGWHMRESIRHMMRFHADPFGDTAERIEQARALLNFLAGAVPPETGAYGQWLHSELDLVRQCSDYYIFHEHLETVNAPLYFHQFMERAVEQGLQFLAEADFSTMLSSRLPEDVAKTLEHISADIVHLEQYMDFVRNRLFRQTLLCRKAAPLRRSLGPHILEPLLIRANLSPETVPLDYSCGTWVKFRSNDGGLLETESPIVKAALKILRFCWPCAMDFESLCAATQQIAMSEVSAIGAETPRSVLLESLFQGFLGKLVQVHVWQPSLSNVRGDYPKVNAFVAHEAGKGESVTNGRNEVMKLDRLSRQLVLSMDGHRTISDLLAEIVGKAQNGALQVSVNDELVLEYDRLMQLLPSILENTLDRLVRGGLLMV